MRSPKEFADSLAGDVEPGGTAQAVQWAFKSSTGSVYLNASSMDVLAFSPESLREIADEAEAHTDDGNDTAESSDDEPDQWDSENDILLQNMSNTVGFAETDDALKPLSPDAQSVLVTPDLLREALDVAEGLATKDALWITVERERPLLATPKGKMRRLSAVLTPRITNSDRPAPSGEL